MFKNLNKIFSGNNKWILAGVVLILIFLLYSYSDSKSNVYDKMSDGGVDVANTDIKVVSNTPPSTNSNLSNLPSNNNYNLQPVANPTELLPKDTNSEWASLNPVGVGGDGIQSPDLLQSGYHIGIDTIGQTLKNPSYDLRSDPVIEKKNISPWNMSTIEPDLARVPLEVGYGSR
jgi:hypothetical protein